MDNKFYILILTKDNFLKTTVVNKFSIKENVEFMENINSKNPINLVLFDDIDMEQSLNKLVKKNPNLITINTSGKNIKFNSATIGRPIKINELLKVINEKLEKKICQNIIKLSDCNVDIQKRIITKNNKVLQSLTERERDIINYLYKNKEVNKKILLDKVWNYSNS